MLIKWQEQEDYAGGVWMNEWSNCSYGICLEQHYSTIMSYTNWDYLYVWMNEATILCFTSRTTVTSARIPEKTLVIARASCVLSHAFKKEHRDWRILRMRLAACILGRAQWHHRRSPDETKYRSVHNASVTHRQTGSTYITINKNLLSGGEITSPAKDLYLTGMYLQWTSPNTKT